MDLYQLNSMVANGQSQIYDRDNLIKVLANVEHSDFANEILWGRLICYHDVSAVKKIYYNRWSVKKQCDHYEFEAKSQHEVTGKELINLYNAAKNFYQQQLHVEQASLKFAKNHPNQENPYGYRWDGQMEYLSKSNLLGQTFAIREEYTDHEYNYPQSFSKSHSTWCNGGHGRTGHPQYAFAKDNHFRKQEIQSLVKEYPNNIIRHSNRQVNKHHSCDFPVFDDPEYLLSRHSTGWKYSSKARHQYNQHVGKTKTFDKRQQSHLFNDWTTQDEYEAHGGDYYAPCWWADQPDPNLTPMSKLPKTQQWNDKHSAFNVNYIKIKKG